MLGGARNRYEGEMDRHGCQLPQVSSALPQQVVRLISSVEFSAKTFQKFL
jgi:hypothetical protein